MDLDGKGQVRRWGSCCRWNKRNVDGFRTGGRTIVMRARARACDFHEELRRRILYFR